MKRSRGGMGSLYKVGQCREQFDTDSERVTQKGTGKEARRRFHTVFRKNTMTSAGVQLTTKSHAKLTSVYPGQMLHCMPSAYTKHHSRRELRKGGLLPRSKEARMRRVRGAVTAVAIKTLELRGLRPVWMAGFNCSQSESRTREDV